MRNYHLGNCVADVDSRTSRPNPLVRYSPRFSKGFVRYLRWYLGRHFHNVLVSIEGLPHVAANIPIIIYSNHPSWWDPMLFLAIGGVLFPERRSFGPMESQSLKRYAMLEHLGAFGVDLDSARGGVEFMLQAQRVLAAPSSILWLTAQGAFTDVRQRPVTLRKGLAYLTRKVKDVVVLPLAIEYPFWNESRPEALCRFGAPIDFGVDQKLLSIDELSEGFEIALTRTMDHLAHDSVQRDPTLFTPLLEGSSGVGGIYDGWRRWRSWLRGERFDAAHERRT